MLITSTCLNRSKSLRLTPISAAAALIIAILTLAGMPALGQERYQSKVNINVDKVRNIMAFSALSVDSSLWDEKLTSPDSSQLLRAIGVTTVRYPGNVANRYHWSTHKPTPAHGSDPSKAEYLSPNTDFGHFAKMLDHLGGTAIITVNYGTNLGGTGGGEPAEAAAWVAYANGDPSDTKVIGKDSSGNDWKTVGYWAGMRASAPLATDDGYNFLRISHPQPLRIRYWEIGNDVHANGFYAKDGKNMTEEDLHAPYGSNAGESEKLRNHNAKLSPTVYGDAVVDFAKAMKSVDATIRIGAVLATPPIKGAFAQAGAQIEHSKDDATYNAKRLAGSGGWLSGVSEGSLRMDDSQDWNRGVMKACGNVIDFVVIHWRFGKLLPPDYKTADGPGTLTAPYSDLPQIVTALVDLFNKYGGARNLQMAFTGLSAWGTESDPTLQALFLTEAYTSLIESGSLSTVGADAHGQGFLDSNNKPGPLAYALGMIHIFARPNDAVVQSESSSSLLGVHAAKRADGSLALMLINKDPARTVSVKVSLSGAKIASKGVRFDFGKNTNGLPVKGKDLIDAGENFTVDVPPYTITDLLLPKAQ